MVPTSQMSVSIFPAALFVVVAFAGFVVRLPSLPRWLGSWAPLLSFGRWAFQGLVINEFAGNKHIDYSQIIPPNVPNPYNVFIENFGFQNYDKWESLPILGISLGALWIICYVPIKFISFEKR